MRTIEKLEGITVIEGKEKYENTEYGYKASLVLTVIRISWHKGCDFEDLADGFGPGCGTHGDWSAIRDSSPESIMSMLERSLNYIAYHLS